MKLSIENITLLFSGLTVINDFSFEVDHPSIFAIIGPNGAGKTSLINCIFGFYKPQKGDIFVDDICINKYKPHQIAKLRLARFFQNIELFRHLSVLDNILLGRHNDIDYGPFNASIYFGKTKREEIQHREKVEEIIDFLEMEDIRKELVGNLPYGLKKKVEFGRALAMDPKLLFLDEPTSGMTQEEKEDIVRFIIGVERSWQIPIIIVEHDMNVVMDISHRVTVMNSGVKIAEGPPEEVQADPEVIRAYLGQKEGKQ